MGSKYLLLIACFVAAAAADSSQCWQCTDASSNDQCQANGQVVDCDDGATNGCQTQLRTDSNGNQRITKGCKAIDVCRSEKTQYASQCIGLTASNSICYFCCETEKCNWCLNESGNCGDDSGESGSNSKSKCKSKSKSKSKKSGSGSQSRSEESYDDDECDDGGARGVCAGVVITWIVTLIGYNLIR